MGEDFDPNAFNLSEVNKILNRFEQHISGRDIDD